MTISVSFAMLEKVLLTTPSTFPFDDDPTNTTAMSAAFAAEIASPNSHAPSPTMAHPALYLRESLEVALDLRVSV